MRSARSLAGPASASAADIGLLVLRVLAGTFIAYHGWQKLQNGIAGFEGFLTSLGVPAPALMARAVTALELVGGLLVAVGLLTRVWAVLLAVEMVFTTWLVKADVGLIAPPGGGAGAELDLLFFGAFVAIALLGPGRWSVDGAILDRRGGRLARA